MKKRDKLIKWAQKQGWFYLADVPWQTFGMTRQDASTALISFCRQGRADFRVVGLKQYRVKHEHTQN